MIEQSSYSNDVWESGVLDKREFSCDQCDFSILGEYLCWLEWHKNSVAEENGVIIECPKCLVNLLEYGYAPWSRPFISETRTIDDSLFLPKQLGYITIPHICGVTNDCECDS